MRTRILIAAVGLALLVTACGSGGHTAHDASRRARTETIDMQDIAFSTSALNVTKGDTVTFRFTNKGKVIHEAIIGDAAAQQAHAMSMSSTSAHQSTATGMDHGAGHDTSSLTLDPGKSGELTYTFDEQGTVIIGCHEPGHYEAGMKVTITVT